MKAAIFDMDGTLLDSMGMWHSLAPYFCSQHNIEWTEEMERSTMEMGLFLSAEYYHDKFPQLNMSVDELLKSWVKLAQNGYKNVVLPKPGVINYLKKLKSEGIPCVVATMSYHLLSDAALSRHDIDSLVKCILTPEDVGGSGKDSPSLFLKAAEVLKTPPADCVVFEDSLLALETATKAGFQVCAVNEPLNKDSAEINKLYKHRITDFNELL